MKRFNKLFFPVLIVSILLFLPGCELIADIFGAGVWVGIIISAIVVILLVWLVIKILKGLRK